MNAIILSIGDELVLGQTIDTNSAWLSQQLAQVGIPVSAHMTVGDDQKAIEAAILDAAQAADILLISGGIGPTPDDLTRQALSSVLDRPLELNEKWLEQLHEFFTARGRRMPEMNRIQAMIPRSAEVIWNHNGTAAGIKADFRIRLEEEDGTMIDNTCRIFVMPGVPKEMRLMFERSILPRLKENSSGGVILSKTLHTFGQGESTIAELLGPLMDRSRNPSVGTTVSAGIVSVRINSRFDSKPEAEHRLTDAAAACYSALGDLIFGEDDTTLPQSVAALLTSPPSGFVAVTMPTPENKMLTVSTRAATVATAESCTGGLLAKMLTDIPGSSAWFKQGWVTYSNESKEALLNVPAGLIEQFGAVSEAVVKVMANSARARARCDYALAISGIAGPSGGSSDKPVGTVCIALAHPKGVQTRTFLFPGDREMIRDRSAKMALTMLRFHLLNKPLPF